MRVSVCTCVIVSVFVRLLTRSFVPVYVTSLGLLWTDPQAATKQFKAAWEQLKSEGDHMLLTPTLCVCQQCRTASALFSCFYVSHVLVWISCFCEGKYKGDTHGSFVAALLKVYGWRSALALSAL